MASATIPIQKLRVDSTLSVSISRSSALPPLLRKILKLWLFPSVLRYTNNELSGERLGKITAAQAAELFGPLQQFHSDLRDIIAESAQHSWIVRTFTASWIRRLSAETDRLGDIVEALAWGADSELRAFVNQSVEDLQDTHR